MNLNCCFNKNNNKQLLTSYWGGYFENDNRITLDMTPNYIDIVNLAFIGPNSDSTVETSFLRSNYTEEQIKEWIKICHNKGIKVFVSILDTPNVHWDKINLIKFAKNLKSLIDDWKIDGVDIDAESGMDSNSYIQTFINLAKIIKTTIGNLPLTYTCYTGIEGPDGNILTEIQNIIDYIQLMAYYDTYDGMINLYNNYKVIMENRIIIGVKAGNPDGTDINEVKKLCLWNTNKKGIMLWSINRDSPYYTKQKIYTWSKIIKNNLNLNGIYYYIKYIENCTLGLF